MTPNIVMHVGRLGVIIQQLEVSVLVYSLCLFLVFSRCSTVSMLHNCLRNVFVHSESFTTGCRWIGFGSTSLVFSSWICAVVFFFTNFVNFVLFRLRFHPRTGLVPLLSGASVVGQIVLRWFCASLGVLAVVVSSLFDSGNLVVL